jgi:hypothetical protein
MTQIILDTSVASKLIALDRPVELCDASGQVLGKFIPLVNLSGWEPVSPDITEEELERRVKSNEKRYTTAEVLSHLKKL